VERGPSGSATTRIEREAWRRVIPKPTARELAPADITSDPERPEDLAQRAEAVGYATEGADHGRETRGDWRSGANQLFACSAGGFPGTMSRIEQTGALRQVLFKAEASL
jgi:hypothetical protein